MVWIDYAILGVVGLSVLISLVRGFAREAMSLVVWVLAFLISSRFYEDLAVYLTQVDDPMLRNGAAIAALFVATLILGGLLNYLVGQMVDRTGLTGTDRLLGAVFGAARGALVVAAALFFFDSFTPAASSDWWQDSLLIPEFKVVIQWFFQYLEQSSSFLPKI
ncbi:bacteriocin production protein [Ferrimonas sediminicola]|uniref:Bacteriocin production protein n=1 Tax=Ferrimonas sediminicola TaxID=2569538 RepID=A0A4U1BH05_9GAMM|nr:CvpA family protein [Ferrimonas sediminicola]TKB50012.1 bacteriocin production protein [Ferrimonas sediminicola]